MKEIQGKPLVNHRWQLPSVEEIVDQMLPKWSSGRHPDFSGPDGHSRLRGALLQFAEGLMSHLQIHLEKAAGRGISEALALMQNPDYYETVKKRRSRSVEQGKKWRAQQDAQAKERERRQRGELTEEERIEELARITYEMNYHQTELDKLRARRMSVETSTPIVISKAQITDASDGDNEWPDALTFD